MRRERELTSGSIDGLAAALGLKLAQDARSPAKPPSGALQRVRQRIAAQIATLTTEWRNGQP
jgi:hypothetical protein